MITRAEIATIIGLTAGAVAKQEKRMGLIRLKQRGGKQLTYRKRSALARLRKMGFGVPA